MASVATVYEQVPYCLTEADVWIDRSTRTTVSPAVLAERDVSEAEDVCQRIIVWYGNRVAMRVGGTEISVRWPPGTGTVPPAMIAALGSLEGLMKLGPGWNSYGARPIDAANVFHAVRVLSGIVDCGTPPPAVVPMIRGGVQLEWHTRGIDMEISIHSPDRVKVYCEDTRSRETWEGDLRGNEPLIRTWVRRLSI